MTAENRFAIPVGCLLVGALAGAIVGYRFGDANRALRDAADNLWQATSVLGMFSEGHLATARNATDDALDTALALRVRYAPWYLPIGRYACCEAESRAADWRVRHPHAAAPVTVTGVTPEEVEAAIRRYRRP